MAGNENLSKGNGLRWIVRRALTTVKHEGLPSFVTRSFAFAGYKMGLWYVGWFSRTLDEPIVPVPPRLDGSISLLTAEDAQDYVRFHSNISSEEYLERLGRGQYCFVVRDASGELASATWVATASVWIDFVDREVTLQEDEVYLYDSYTAPQFRGKRLQPYLCADILTEIRDKGYRRAAVIIAPENRSNIASRQRSGFRKTGNLFRIRIGSLRRDFFRPIRSSPTDS